MRHAPAYITYLAVQLLVRNSAAQPQPRQKHAQFPKLCKFGWTDIRWTWPAYKKSYEFVCKHKYIASVKKKVVKLQLQDAVETTRRESRDCPRCGDGLPEEEISSQTLRTCATLHASHVGKSAHWLFACKVESAQPCMQSARLHSYACECA